MPKGAVRRRWRGRATRALAGLFAIAGCASMASSCSLGNVAQDDCASDAECAAAFGAGSRCDEGYCTGGMSCATASTCRASLGYGVGCASGSCVAAPLDARCTLSEPPELLGDFPGPITDRIVFGGIFKLGTGKERARADAVRLAVREINQQDGISGTPLGVVLCDNDIDNDASDDTEQTAALARHLAGDLGLPLLLGPSLSDNVIIATNTLLQDRLASAIITPSATSAALADLIDRFDPESDPHGLLWRTCPSDALQGKVLANRIATDVTMPNAVAVVFQKDSYGQGLEEAFRGDFQALGVDHTVQSSGFDLTGDAMADDAAISAAVAAADAAAGVDALLIISSDAARTVRILELVSQSAQLATLPLLFLTDGSKDKDILLNPGPSLTDQTNLQGVQSLIDKAFGTAPASPSGTSYGTFAMNYQSAFGTNPSEFSFLAQSYDAGYIGVYAMAYAAGLKADYDGFDVADGLSRLSAGEAVAIGPTQFQKAVSGLRAGEKTIDVTGTSGPLDFDAVTGEAPGPIEVWDVQNGAFVTVTTVTP